MTDSEVVTMATLETGHYVKRFTASNRYTFLGLERGGEWTKSNSKRSDVFVMGKSNFIYLDIIFLAI